MAKFVKGMPITGARPENKPVRNVLSNQAETSLTAERQVRRPPMPFQTRNSAVSIPAPVNRAGSFAARPQKHPNIGVAPGMRKHVPGSVNAHPGYRVSAPKQNPAAVGGGMPGGYNKVVGGRLGTSHPKGTGHSGAPGVRAAKSAFFGG